MQYESMWIIKDYILVYVYVSIRMDRFIAKRVKGHFWNFLDKETIV